MRKTAFFISLSILIISFASAFYFYPELPETIVTHWGVYGEPNGFSHKGMVLILPIISMFAFLLLLWLPKLDPLKKNIDKFADSYDDFILVFNLMMYYISSLTIIWNLGLNFNMGTAIIPAIALMFYFIGVMLSSTKRNYTIGVRTPWALENDEVWDKTNKASARVFKIVAMIALVSVLVPKLSFFMFIISLIVGLIYIFIYSYVVYRDIEKGEKNKNSNK
jgi:uncharacterized membrane protein